MKKAVHFPVLFALLILQQSTTTTYASDNHSPSPLPVVVVNKTYDLGCGIHLIPAPESVETTTYFQSLGNALRAKLFMCTPLQPRRTMIFIIRSASGRLEVKMRNVNQGIELIPIDTALEKSTDARTAASKIFDGILPAIGLFQGKY